MRRALMVLVAAAWLAGGAAEGAPPPSLTVFAAADLAFALREVAARFEQGHGVTVTLVFGSTGQLAKQIEHGAPADVFFAANRSFVDDLAAKGAVIPDTRALYAQGRLVLVMPRGAAPKLIDLRQLVEPRVRRVAIANPQHAPYGKAAEQALRSLGLWDTLRPKLVYGENIRQALQYVETGAADAGIVARSVAGVPTVESSPVDPALHEPLDQALAVVKRSPRPELGLAFAQFVNGPEGRPIMKHYGFLLPGEF